MAIVPSVDSPTLAPPRITVARFKQLLNSKGSRAIYEADEIYAILVSQNVDVSFALAQFRVESQYGTAGYAAITGSWGNMLYDSNLTVLALPEKYSPGNGYTYAQYDNYQDAIIDYCRYIHWYKEQYNLDTIYEATARWIGKTPGSPGHLNYVSTIISDMVKYEYPDGGYESGDKMIYAGAAFDRLVGKIVQKYPVTNKMPLYRGTDGALLKYYSGPTSTPGDMKTYAWWLGFVNGAKDWGTIFIGTSSADADATLVYIKSPDPKKIVSV